MGYMYSIISDILSNGIYGKFLLVSPQNMYLISTVVVHLK